MWNSQQRFSKVLGEGWENSFIVCSMLFHGRHFHGLSRSGLCISGRDLRRGAAPSLDLELDRADVGSASSACVFGYTRAHRPMVSSLASRKNGFESAGRAAAPPSASRTASHCSVVPQSPLRLIERRMPHLLSSFVEVVAGVLAASVRYEEISPTFLSGQRRNQGHLQGVDDQITLQCLAASTSPPLYD